ncbi:MAG: site-specific integrase, partial [Holosporaceae bacterium]|nr:site-specific integrase [Holosporaceae bacterium]
METQSNSLRGFVEIFVEHLRSERNSSENTIESYVFDLSDFTAFADFDTSVSENDIIRYLSFLKEKQLSTSTIKRKLSALRQFFKFLCSEELVAVDPMSFIHQPKHRRPLPKIISEETVVKLRNATDSLKYHEKIRADLMLYLLYGSGLRVSELISLRRNSVSDSKFIRIFGKGSRERAVPLAEKVLSLA